MMTTGNATDFGDLTAVRMPSRCSIKCNSWSIRSGGTDASTRVNTIDFITIATTGNAKILVII